MHNDLNERRKAKKRLALNSRDIHVGWIVGAGVSMLIFLLATFATAYRHDAYSSRLGLRDLMTTDVWFRVFLALTCFSLLLFLGCLFTHSSPEESADPVAMKNRNRSQS